MRKQFHEKEMRKNEKNSKSKIFLVRFICHLIKDSLAIVIRSAALWNATASKRKQVILDGKKSFPQTKIRKKSVEIFCMRIQCAVKKIAKRNPDRSERKQFYQFLLTHLFDVYSTNDDGYANKG